MHVCKQPWLQQACTDKAASLPLPGGLRKQARQSEERAPPVAVPITHPHSSLVQQAAWGKPVPTAPRHGPA